MLRLNKILAAIALISFILMAIAGYKMREEGHGPKKQKTEKSLKNLPVAIDK